MTESAHLIWKLRCERCIAKGDDPTFSHTDTEIHNKWVSALNKRIAIDCALTDKTKYGRMAIPEGTVYRTWRRCLKNESDLPEKWIKSLGVLVCIAALRPPGRNG